MFPSSAFHRSRHVVLVAALPLVALLAGCSSNRRDLARVGPRTVTVEDFMNVARANVQQYAGSDANAGALLLDDLVRRDLMLAAADAMGLYRDSLTARFQHATANRVLAGELYQRLVPAGIGVTAAEVDSFYRWRAIEARIQIIYAPSRTMVGAAMAALRAGEDFGAVADRFSPTRMLPPGGDLGYLQPGSLVYPLDGFLRVAPVGVLRGPVEAPGEGWFIARILDRRAVRNRPPIESERPAITSAIQQRKRRAVSSRAFEDLAAQYRVRTEPGAAQELFMIANRQRFSTGDADALPPPEQRTRAVVRYEDGLGRPLAYTLGEALEDLEAHPDERPNFMMLPAIETWLQSQGVQRAAVVEARRRHLHEEPAIAKQIEERVNSYVLDQVYGRLVADLTDPTDEGVRAAYRRHASAYPRLGSVRLLHATLSDSAAAAALARMKGRAGTLHEAAKSAGPLRVVEERVRYPNERAPWKTLEASFLSAARDEWMGPMKVPGGWMVLQLLDKEQSVQPYDMLPPAIQQNLKEEAVAMRRERRLAQFTDSLRAVVKPFEIHRDRLSRIPWPVPAAGPGGGI